MSSKIEAPSDLIRPVMDIDPTRREQASWDDGMLAVIGRIAAALRRVGNSRKVVEDFYMGAMEVGPDEVRAFILEWVDLDTSALTGEEPEPIIAVSDKAELDAANIEHHFKTLATVAPILRMWILSGLQLGMDLESMLFFASTNGLSLAVDFFQHTQGVDEDE
jgi:hypothetical protein